MTEQRDDMHLKVEFRRVREAERQAAPDYRTTLASPVRSANNERFRPALQFAFVTAVLVVVIAAFLNTGHDQAMPASAETAAPLWQETDLMANLEMPTDFLLDTPWFDIARTTPDFEFEFPQYDLPEELSDEI